MKINKITIGTRGSQLSLAQTEIVKRLLLAHAPRLSIEITIIKTTGDKDMSPIPLDSIGKGWFTKELDKALLDGTIDLAVHSLKDLPETLPEGLLISAIPEREDAREALVTTNGVLLKNLAKGASIGTDSTRRRAQILQKRPDLVVESVRGNVNRRLEKLANGEYDALVLAVAGLKRIGLEKWISEYFSPTDFIPSPGQGALAIVTRKADTVLNKFVKVVNHPQTIAAIRSERAFSATIGGGCKMPVGAYATCDADRLTIYGMVGSLDGKHGEKESLTGDITKPIALGKKLANILAKKTPWYRNERFVVITRPKNESAEFIKTLADLGISTLSYPTIAVTKNSVTSTSLQNLKELEQYDWIIFTSKNGVHYFMTMLKELGIASTVLQGKHIAAVGPKTAEAVKKYKFPVHFIPSRFTTEDLAEELKNISGKKILLPRSKIATPLLLKQLQRKGATVVNVPVYQTTYVTKHTNEFSKLLANNKILCVTFTSPSTVTGFTQSLTPVDKERVFSLPVLVIGSVTAAAAKEQGFTAIYTADTFTIEGMIRKFQESIL